MVRGLAPKLRWRTNPSGQKRSITAAVDIAKANGVDIPDYITFFVDELQSLDEHTTARGPRITKPDGEYIAWSEFLNRFGKVPIIIRPDVLDSDEAIVGVLAHETFEVTALRRLLARERMTIGQFGAHTCPNNPGNLHDQAWDLADALVEKMRRKQDDA